MFSGVSTGGDNEGDVEVMFSGLASIVTGVSSGGDNEGECMSRVVSTGRKLMSISSSLELI